MSNNATEIAVGTGVLAVAAGFLVFALQSTGFSTQTSAYQLTASFRSADGISVGSDVRLAGVKVGTITDLDLNVETFRADAKIAFIDGIEVPDDSAIVISSEGLLGGNYVEVVPGGSPFNFESGDEVEDTQGAVSLVSLLMKFVSGGDN